MEQHTHEHESLPSVTDDARVRPSPRPHHVFLWLLAWSSVMVIFSPSAPHSSPCHSNPQRSASNLVTLDSIGIAIYLWIISRFWTARPNPAVFATCAAAGAAACYMPIAYAATLSCRDAHLLCDVVVLGTLPLTVLLLLLSLLGHVGSRGVAAAAGALGVCLGVFAAVAAPAVMRSGGEKSVTALCALLYFCVLAVEAAVSAARERTEEVDECQPLISQLGESRA